ncbi:hypothetical protein PIROE2DRAFT_64578 [Piromyces sp. E2]|nr:hypothetical protein PIROE2DRAFT_64578 [Piromyces sp. E2]|eukprot:OUM58205.1 hypothetical protein PIROE2DRAFT_64578 [Piromyces sp. E2]
MSKFFLIWLVTSLHSDRFLAFKEYIFFSQYCTSEEFFFPYKDLNFCMIFKGVYDWDKDTENDLIGTFKVTTNDLLTKDEFEIINEKKKKKDSYKNSGVLTIKLEKVRTKGYSFIEYPYGGTEMAVSFAIDFTGSNGLQHLPESLHYNKPDYDINNFYTLNDYEKALSAIGYVLEPYDTNKYFEVYGYGGKFFGKKTVEFDCALTGDQNKPSVFGVAGVMEVYHKALQKVYLSKFIIIFIEIND